MKPVLFYCYDALCQWCFSFSPVVKQLEEAYKEVIDFEVLSGGMVMPDHAQPIAVIAKYTLETYPQIEKMTGVKFGEDYLWHMRNPEQSDWMLTSEKPAIALCIFKEYFPDKAVQMASDIQKALMVEGRDLTDNEAYRHLLYQYQIDPEEFYEKLKSEEYLDKAYYEFALVKQLKVEGYPTVLLQVTDSKFYLLGRGYADFDTMKARIDKVLEEIKTAV